MRPGLSDNALAVVTRSQPLMERHRERLHRAIGRYMARCSPHDRASGRNEAAGRVLMDMLVDYAGQVGRAGRGPHLREAARRRGLPGLAADDYSRFGDGLGAVIKDVLGPDASPALLWAWGDAYWAIVRATRRVDLPLAA